MFLYTPLDFYQDTYQGGCCYSWDTPRYAQLNFEDSAKSSCIKRPYFSQESFNAAPLALKMAKVAIQFLAVGEKQVNQLTSTPEGTIHIQCKMPSTRHKADQLFYHLPNHMLQYYEKLMFMSDPNYNNQRLLQGQMKSTESTTLYTLLAAFELQEVKGVEFPLSLVPDEDFQLDAPSLVSFQKACSYISCTKRFFWFSFAQFPIWNQSRCSIETQGLPYGNGNIRKFFKCFCITLACFGASLPFSSSPYHKNNSKRNLLTRYLGNESGN